MRVVNPQAALLTNHEVLLHLQAQQAEYSGSDGKGCQRKIPIELEESLRDALHYLTTPDYALSDVTRIHPDRPMTLYKGSESLLRALAHQYRINKTEYLQLYNLQPRTQFVLQAILEEAPARFNNAALEDILEIITRIFDTQEALIPHGVEHQNLPKLPRKQVTASRSGRRRAKPPL